MAAANTNKLVTSGPGSAERAAIIEVNTLRQAVRTMMTKLDNDAGVTDVNYTSLFDAAIGNNDIRGVNGNAITDP